MNKELNEILIKIKKHNEFLASIDLVKLSKSNSRLELKNFINLVDSLKTRSISYELGKIVLEMKKDEFPELLGVHHFPQIKTFDFLSDQEKIDVDNFLVSFRKNNFLQGFWRVLHDEKKVKLLMDALVNNNIAEELYAIDCPSCNEGKISTFLKKDEMEKITNTFLKGDYEEKETCEEKYLQYCSNCDEYISIHDIDKISFTKYFRMKAERDKSLDDV